jgi:hypothetical protein
METFLTVPVERRRMFCEEAHARLGLAPASIEKDFWVCWTLRALFRLPAWDGHLTFKGGTSLSKGWGLIARFSEDIDVVIDRAFLGFGEEVLSRSRRDRLRDACRLNVQYAMLPALAQHIHDHLPGGLDWDLASADHTEDPEYLTLLFRYPTAFAESATYLRPFVKMEFGGRADTEPVEMPFNDLINGVVSSYSVPRIYPIDRTTGKLT